MQSRIITVTTLAVLGITVTGFAQGERYFRVAGPVQTYINSFQTNGYITWTNQPTNAAFTVQTATSLKGPSNWVDYIQVPATNASTTHWLFDPNPPSGMTLVPAGLFQMGDAFIEGGFPVTNDIPLHIVNVSAFYIDKYEVTEALWDEVFQWATNNGYAFDNSGSFDGLSDYSKGPGYPVTYVNWYDAVKWCNARSEKELLVPAYYTDGAQTNVYRSGQLTNLLNDCVKWFEGYRLPTEAEWEKAARGGPIGRRFSWSDTDTILHSRANYNANTNLHTYDVSATLGLHPSYNAALPYTSPGGSFAANGYAVYDTSGNVWEWCWDKYDSSWYGNPLAVLDDTRGPVGTVSDNASRISRGGAYGSDAFNSRVAFRRANSRTTATLDRGFRSVLPVEPALSQVIETQ